jgi:hypothetical protein
MSVVAVVDNYAILVNGTNFVYYMDINKATWQTVVIDGDDLGFNYVAASSSTSNGTTTYGAVVTGTNNKGIVAYYSNSSSTSQVGANWIQSSTSNVSYFEDNATILIIYLPCDIFQLLKPLLL